MPSAVCAKNGRFVRTPASARLARRGLLGRVGRARALSLDRSGPALHAMVASAGVSRETSAGYDWHGLRRGRAEFVLLQYTLAGRGMLEFEGARRVIEPGRAMLLYFPHPHRYWLDPSAGGVGRSWTFFYLCLHGQEVVRAWQAAVKRLGPVVAMAEDDAWLVEAGRLCLDVLSDRVVSPWSASARAYALAMGLLERALPGRMPDDAADARAMPRSGSAGRDAALDRARDLAREAFARPMSVDDLARAAGMSRWHFSRLFRQRFGASPGDYLIRLRLRAALARLRTGDEPVKAIAYGCGFGGATAFCKAFRRAMGVSPGAFRRSGLF